MRVYDASSIEEAVGKDVLLALNIGVVMQGRLLAVDREGGEPVYLRMQSGGEPWAARWAILTMVWEPDEV